MNRLRLQVIATDESIRGNLYNVFILCVPLHELSKGNQTLPFVIRISDQIVDFPDLYPMFDVFPSSQTYFISEEEQVKP